MFHMRPLSRNRFYFLSRTGILLYLTHLGKDAHPYATP